MSIAKSLKRFLRSTTGRADSENELDEELRFHVDMEIQRHRENGLSQREARRIAMRDFGGIESTKEAVRDTSGVRWLFDFVRDLRFSIRALIRRPVFFWSTVITISVAAATAAVVLAATRQVLWTPLPNANHERIVVLYETDLAQVQELQGVSPGNFLEWEQRATSFERLGLAEPWSLDTIIDGRPATYGAWAVSRDFLETMGLTPMLGRAFDPSEFEKDDAAEVLLTYQGWRRIFASDESILGKTLDTEGGRVTIVGVLPPDVDLPAARDFWFPRPTRPWDANTRSGSWMFTAGRLKPGQTMENAQADMNRVAAVLSEQYPDSNDGAGVSLASFHEKLLSTVGPAIRALGIAAVCFFLAACATIASMLLTRLHAQGGEFAMRLALGANRTVLMRQVSSEVLVICVVAGVIGASITAFYLGMLASGLPDNLALLTDLQADGFAIGTSMLIALLMGACCLVLPLLHIARSDQRKLQSAERSTGKQAILRFRSILITIQVAIAVVLLIGASLMLRSLNQFLDTDIGFSADNRVSLLVFGDYDQSALERVAYFDELMAAILGVTGVNQVAGVSALPFHPTQIDPEATFELVDEVLQDAGQRLSTHTLVATPGYFAAMNIELLKGRPFTEFDLIDTNRVAIINQTMADRYWADTNPIGRRINVGVMGPSTVVEIVGVSADTRPFGYDSPPRPEVFVPQAQAAAAGLTLVAKTDVAPETLIPMLQDAIWKVAPDQAIYHSTTLQSLVDKSAEAKNFATKILSTFAAGALGLAILGIYSLVSYTVALRQREFGIRMAVGATPGRIRSGVARRNLLLTLAGAIPGLLFATLISDWLRPLLYGIDSFDMPTYLGAAAVIVAAGLVAALIPAWNASRRTVAVLLKAPG